MDVLIAIDALDDLIHNAKMVPLSDAIRIDRDDLLEQVERMREGLRAELDEAYRTGSMRLLEQLEQMARDAPPVRILGGVRMDKERVYDVLDGMRATIPEEIRVQRGGAPPPAEAALAIAVEDLDFLLRDAKAVPLSDYVRVDGAELRQAVAAVRAGAGEHAGADAMTIIAQFEEIARGARTIPLASDVRVDRARADELLDQLRALLPSR